MRHILRCASNQAGADSVFDSQKVSAASLMVRRWADPSLSTSNRSVERAFGVKMTRKPQDDAGDRYAVEIDGPDELSFERLLELEEQEEEAELQEARDLWGHEGERVTITIPGAYAPLERLRRFEAPLEERLGERAIVYGGGTAEREVDGRLEVIEVDVSLRVADFEQALPAIRVCLKAQGAPQGTVIRRSSLPDTTYPVEPQ